MSWSDRRGVLAAALALAGVAAAGGCGFRPLYGAGESGAETRGRVAVSTPEGRLGFHFRERLDRRLGGPVDPSEADFLLKTSLTIGKTGLAITADNATTRYRLNGEARYELIDAVTGTAVLKGRVATISAYSATASLFATRSAERDAERRVVTDLAERVAIRVAAMADRVEDSAS